MTKHDFRAQMHAVICDALHDQDAIAIADDFLAEAIAANTTAGSRATTAALLRKFADQLDGADGR